MIYLKESILYFEKDIIIHALIDPNELNASNSSEHSQSSTSSVQHNPEIGVQYYLDCRPMPCVMQCKYLRQCGEDLRGIIINLFPLMLNSSLQSVIIMSPLLPPLSYQELNCLLG